MAQVSDVVTKIRLAIRDKRYEPDANGIMSQNEYTLCMLGPKAYRDLLNSMSIIDRLEISKTFMGLRVVETRSEGIRFE